MPGAASYKSGIITDKQNIDKTKKMRTSLALVGKVFCKVDTSYAPIEVGDLLTTSDTIEHAMKAMDRSKAFGAVIGKALGSIKKGQSLIPSLVSLQ